MDHEYQVRCSKFAVYVAVKNRVIVDAAPMVRNFIGQPFEHLTRWMGKFEDFEVKELFINRSACGKEVGKC
jgi:hypothetical protein